MSYHCIAFSPCQDSLNNVFSSFRYDASYMKGEDVWELRIKNVEERDSGLFECQVHMFSFVYWPFKISKDIGIVEKRVS